MMIFKIYNRVKSEYIISQQRKKLQYFFSNIYDKKILLFGYQKSGNTWLRLLLYNYRTLLINPNTKQTLTYKMLNELQNNHLDGATTNIPKKGYPYFYRTHSIYSRKYELFDQKIFIHRNPLDTLISSYYFWKQRDLPFKYEQENIRNKLHDIDFYVLYKIKYWIKFFNISSKHADFTINYSELKNNIEETFYNLLNYLNWEIDKVILKKAIEISSFEKVKNMGKANNQEYGNAINDGSFNGVFTRSGKEGQFVNELKKETINCVLNQFPEFYKIYPDLKNK